MPQSGDAAETILRSLPVSFAPGGYHLMCVKPSNNVKPGNSIKMTLTLDDGGTLAAAFKVRNAKGE